MKAAKVCWRRGAGRNDDEKAGDVDMQQGSVARFIIVPVDGAGGIWAQRELSRKQQRGSWYECIIAEIAGHVVEGEMILKYVMMWLEGEEISIFLRGIFAKIWPF